MSADLTLNHEYLPLSGMKAFCDASTRLLLGESSPAISQNRVRSLKKSCFVSMTKINLCTFCLSVCVAGMWSTGHFWYWFYSSWL